MGCDCNPAVDQQRAPHELSRSGEVCELVSLLCSGGGSVDSATGKYTAGATPEPGSVDLVQVTDSLGNQARVTIHPTTVVVAASGGPRGCDCATAGGGAIPGLPASMFALLAIALMARRRSRRTGIDGVRASGSRGRRVCDRA